MVAQGFLRKATILAFLAVGIVTLTAGIVLWQTYDGKKDADVKIQMPTFPDPSSSPLGVYEKAAVSCDAPLCADIGKDVLQEGGNVVDAAIATLFCMGVIQTQSMGIGGGFLMVLYNATTGESVALNARETAPASAFEDMFDGDSELSSRGGLAVAVPGEVKGYWELFQRYGSGAIEWARLVQPTIEICRNGFLVSRHAAGALSGQSSRILATPSMAEIFVNNATGKVFLQNDTMTRPVLANTLEIIAQQGADALYSMDSQVMRDFVDDLNEQNGSMTYEDMVNYAVRWEEPIKMDLSGGLKIHTVPPPGSGILLSFILKLMDGRVIPEMLQDFHLSSLTYHRFVEALKFAYAKRTLLGDPIVGDPEHIDQVQELIRNLTSTEYIDSLQPFIQTYITNNTYEYYGAEFYQSENHGTSHVSIIGENGDAIAVTSTVNLHFGAAIRSRRTGIIYNDEMDDFSAPNITNSFGVPPSPTNFIRPGKRPVSSMCSLIITDSEGRARLVIGGAGGTHITTSVAYASIRNLWLNQTIKEAIDTPRLHHQLYPMELKYESGFPEEYAVNLRGRNHTSVEIEPGSSVVVGVSRDASGTIYANSDHRKEGTIAGY